MGFKCLFLPGSNFRSRCRNSGRSADEAIHEAGPGECTRQSQSEREAGHQMEIWNGGWKDEDIARDRGVDGC
jgi:hypothetical protein